jgi:hypothetical protein
MLNIPKNPFIAVWSSGHLSVWMRFAAAFVLIGATSFCESPREKKCSDLVPDEANEGHSNDDSDPKLHSEPNSVHFLCSSADWCDEITPVSIAFGSSLGRWKRHNGQFERPFSLKIDMHGAGRRSVPDLFVLGSTRDSFSIRMFGYINALTSELLECLSCDYQPK